MSGSGGGSYSGSFSYVGGAIDCQTFVVATQIASPNEEVLQGVTPGEVLDVGTTDSRGVVVVVAFRGGCVAGGFASPQLQELRDCIERGFRYVADVLAVDGLRVQVRVRPR